MYLGKSPLMFCSSFAKSVGTYELLADGTTVKTILEAVKKT